MVYVFPETVPVTVPVRVEEDVFGEHVTEIFAVPVDPDVFSEKPTVNQVAEREGDVVVPETRV